jgi:hypothetical protein
MKTVLTIPEVRRVLNKATMYLMMSQSLVDKLTINDCKAKIIHEVLEDSEPGTCYTLEDMFNLTPREKELAYAAINHVLQTKALQIAFANEYDDEGTAYPMMFLNVDLEGLLC